VRPPNVGLPHLIVGLPLAGKVFDKPYFAVGEPSICQHPGKTQDLQLDSRRIEPGFKRPSVVDPPNIWLGLQQGFPNSRLKRVVRSLKPQFGVEISISGLVKTLSKSSGSTPKTTTPSTVPTTN